VSHVIAKDSVSGQNTPAMLSDTLVAQPQKYFDKKVWGKEYFRAKTNSLFSAPTLVSISHLMLNISV
jgi:hypothetical protein